MPQNEPDCKCEIYWNNDSSVINLPSKTLYFETIEHYDFSIVTQISAFLDLSTAHFTAIKVKSVLLICVVQPTCTVMCTWLICQHDVKITRRAPKAEAVVSIWNIQLKLTITQWDWSSYFYNKSRFNCECLSSSKRVHDCNFSNKNVFQSKAHLPVADRKSNT